MIYVSILLLIIILQIVSLWMPSWTSLENGGFLNPWELCTGGDKKNCKDSTLDVTKLLNRDNDYPTDNIVMVRILSVAGVVSLFIALLLSMRVDHSMYAVVALSLGIICSVISSILWYISMFRLKQADVDKAFVLYAVSSGLLILYTISMVYKEVNPVSYTTDLE